MAEEKEKPEPAAEVVESCAEGDFLSVVGPVLGGALPVVRHREDHRLEFGMIRPVFEGDSDEPDTFTIHQRGNQNRFDVRPPPESGKGPAKVNSRAFRKNWSSIFGAKGRVGEA